MTAATSRALPSRPRSRRPTRIASLEGPTAPARRLTPLMRLPGARIAVLTGSDIASRSVTDLLTDELTVVASYECIDELIRSERPDVIVVSRELLCDGALALRRLRQRWLTCTLIVIGAANEREAAQLLDIGADNALVAGDELLAPSRRRQAGAHHQPRPAHHHRGHLL